MKIGSGTLYGQVGVLALAARAVVALIAALSWDVPARSARNQAFIRHVRRCFAASGLLFRHASLAGTEEDGLAFAAGFRTFPGG